MRHLKAGKKLNRSASHRRALYRNMAMALIRHERITTTLAKAKAVRPFVEKLITLAKKSKSAENSDDKAKALHYRRLVIARLGSTGNAEIKPGDGSDADSTKIVEKLISDLGARFEDRPGGYTRIIKRHERRLGDAGLTAFLELLKEGEKKVKAHEPAAPAPAVEEDEDEEDEELEDQDEEQEDEDAEDSAEEEDDDEEDEDEEYEDEDEEDEEDEDEDEDDEDEDQEDEEPDKKDEPKS